MTVSINGTNIPSPMRDRGFPVPERFAERVDNGLAETVTAGYESLVWTFPSLSLSEWQWWTSTLLNKQPSLKCPAVLWDDQGAEVSYSSVVVHYPDKPQRISNGRYYNVVIRIDSMVRA